MSELANEIVLVGESLLASAEILCMPFSAVSFGSRINESVRQPGMAGLLSTLIQKLRAGDD